MKIEFSPMFFDLVNDYFQDEENKAIFKEKMNIIIIRNLSNFPLMYGKYLNFSHRFFPVEVKSQKFLILYDFNEKENIITILNLKHEKQSRFRN